MSIPVHRGDGPDIGSRILALTNALAVELHAAPPADLDLDSSIDRDFGLESLARAELLHRIEQEFGVELSDVVLTTAERPRDLVHAVLQAARRNPRKHLPAAIEAVREVEGFARAATLTEVLERHLERRAGQLHIRLLTDMGESEITYAELAEGARRVARGILDAGVEAGSSVAIMLPTCRQYYTTFFGILLSGAVPVPIYPPARPGQIEDHLTRHAGILQNAQASLLITFEEAERAAHLLKVRVPAIRKVITASNFATLSEASALPRLAATDVALIQYTSGSTGNPKGVVLTHANLLANLRGIGRRIRIAPDDVVVSWLPLYHDMGLIGTWLGSFYYALPLIAMPPQRFLARPAEWLRAIDRFRGTISASPNFGYELCTNKIPESEVDGLDLSSWRMAANGAEPVSFETIRRFTERFSKHGFRSEAMAPMYGLAEGSLAITMPPPGRPPLVDCIDRSTFTERGIAVPTAGADVLHVVGCGTPLPEIEVRVAGTGEVELPERSEGRIQFRSPAAASGYHRNPLETQRLFHDHWLESGDLGYVAGRELFVTGRAKDVIIRAGRHFFPQEIEETISGIAGVRKGCVAVFGGLDAGAQTERLVVAAETRERDEKRRQELGAAVRSRIVDLCGAPPDDVLLLPPHSLLKTSSGKLRRSAVRELYERGQLGTTTRPPWLQMVHLYAASIRPEARRAWVGLRDAAYYVYAWLVTALAAPFIWCGIVVTPRLALRRRLLRWFSRALLGMLNIDVAVHTKQMPDGASIVVSNHASYLDGVLLSAALPLSGAFVVKGEFLRRLIPRLFFARLGSVFVERFDPARGVEDTKQLEAAARRGETIIVFPEGTFQRSAGLLPFRMGAFVAAARTGVPVVPVSLRGSRGILRGDDWFPRRGDVTLTIDEPIIASGDGWSAAAELQQKARAAILAASGEPDLEIAAR
ncbi:MAG TPA: AMP-binding protein [Thermoanaerobaculia bacterium]|nr:AMP-binding protein [Thermoanaerobaculia bacterium]